jgi:hypothetical protein
MHCQSQESLDVAYKLKIFNNLDAQILLNDDAIQIHHIKWLFFNVTKAEFGDFLNILLHLTTTTYKKLNICAKHDLHFFKMLLLYRDSVIDCNRIESNDARLLVDDKYCKCRQRHEGVKRLKLV